MGRGSTIRVLGEIPNYVHVKEYVFVCICVCANPFGSLEKSLIMKM